MNTFDKNNRQAIERALQDSDPHNEIGIAVAQAMESFADNLMCQARRTGRFPNQLLLRAPSTEFDEIVIRKTLQAIANTSGHRIEIHWANDSAAS